MNGTHNLRVVRGSAERNPKGVLRAGLRRVCGFTLVEMLLALALGGAVMVFATMYVVNLTHIWLEQGDDEFFQQHADGVTLFLNNAFVRSVGREAARARPGGAGEEQPDESLRRRSGRPEREDAVSWARPPGYSDFDPPMLSFSLHEAPALLVGESGVMPAVNGYLYYDRGAGMAVLWYSRLQRVETLRDVNSTLLSPFITRVEYAYYEREDDRWELFERPEEDTDGQYLMPDALQLTFTYEEEEIVRAVYIPKRRQNVPLF